MRIQNLVTLLVIWYESRNVKIKKNLNITEKTLFYYSLNNHLITIVIADGLQEVADKFTGATEGFERRRNEINKK